MTTLTINIPDNKSELVKQLLVELGVSFEDAAAGQTNNSSKLKEALLKVSVWSDEDLKPIEEAMNHFNSIKPAKW